MNISGNGWKKFLITLAVAAAAFMFVPFLVRMINMDNLSDAASELSSLLIEFAVFFLAACLLRKTRVLKLKKEGLATGLLVGIVPLLMAMRTIPVLVENYQTYGTIMTIPASELTMFLLAYLMIGVCEELLFRGIIQNGIHELLGENTQAKIRAAIFLQALIFGLFHFLNVITIQADFTSCLLQVISATGLGTLIGVIYYRSNKNLWAAIIVHAIIDMGGYIRSGSLLGTKAVDSIKTPALSGVALLQSLAVVMIFALIYIGIAFFASRKKKIEVLMNGLPE